MALKSFAGEVMRADPFFRPQPADCTAAECQANRLNFYCWHISSDLQTLETDGCRSDAVNAMRQWTKCVCVFVCELIFLKYLHICLWSLWPLVGRWAAFSCKRRTLHQSTTHNITSSSVFLAMSGKTLMMKNFTELSFLECEHLLWNIQYMWKKLKGPILLKIHFTNAFELK